MLLQLILLGMAIGGVYAMVGLGYNATYWTLGIVNFAQGEFLMIVVMLTLGLTAWFQIPTVLSLVFALVIGALLSVILERVAINPLMKHPSSIGWIVATLGAGIMLQSGAATIWGTSEMAFPPIFSVRRAIHIGETVLSLQLVLIFLITILVIVLFELFMNKTLFGKAIKATALDREAARMMGIPAKRIITFSVILSAVLAGLAGVLVAPVVSAGPYMGSVLAIKGFATAVLGGMGSSRGTFAAGMIIGVSEMLTSGYLSPAIKDVTSLLILFFILLVMPHGIFGKKVLEKV